ncbi:MAG: hypothetical protein EAZ60_16690 [Oscillatoriales cyanobacterium]|nr:MAG: hypothetical protein EAZ60_16690 [Oscillatoriales cyanobacterium]
MGKKSKAKKSQVKTSTLLSQRLQEALDRGSKVWIKTNNSSYGQVTWLIRLSDIIALAYPTEYWSKDRLESLLPPDAVTSEVGD